jgi:hypothetical protein
MLKAIFLIAFLMLTGCATIISGRHQEVQVISSPHGAKACTGGQCVTTPGTLTLRRDTNHAVLVEKDGYMSETVTLTSGVGAAVAGNIILGGLIGGGIDMASGAAYKLYPETINVALKPLAESSSSSKEAKVQPETSAVVEQPSTPRKQYATLTHVKGPMLTVPPQTMRAEYVKDGDNRGTARVIYPGNHFIDGQYRTVTPGESFKGLVNPTLIDPDQIGNFPTSSLRGFAWFSGSDGTVLECAYALMGAAGLGSCLDNRGNQYNLSF